MALVPPPEVHGEPDRPRRPGFSRGFLEAMYRLVEGGIALAAYLLIESGLIWLARWTLQGGPHAVETILEAIEIWSALGVASLFVLHTVRVFLDYYRHFRDD